MAKRKPFNKKPKRKNKYNAKQVEYDGYRFDSKMEFDRYLMLKQWQEEGEISDLEVHPRWDLSTIELDTGNKKKVCVYEADFRFKEHGERSVVEDVKGVRTALFRLKKKWMILEHGIEVREVTQGLITIPPWFPVWKSTKKNS